MIERAIPSSGETIPVVGLGTYAVFDRTNPRDVLRAFVEHGGRVVDSSPMYGRAESVVGDAVDELGLRHRLFLATKVWTSGKAAGAAQMDDSKRKMRGCDLMQVHNLLDVDAHLDTLAEWKAAGRVRYVGITHYTASAHEAVCAVLARRPVDFVQINYSVAERDAEKRVLPLCRDRGVAVIVNRPFAAGASLSSSPLPAFAAELGCSSWAQLQLKWVLAHPAVTCAIPATSSVAHVIENAAAGSGPLPDEAQRAEIASRAR